MALREHNSNIIAPLYTEDKTWSSPQKVSARSHKEQKVQADRSKENSCVVPSIQKNGKFQKVVVPNIERTFCLPSNDSHEANNKNGTTGSSTHAISPRTGNDISQCEETTSYLHPVELTSHPESGYSSWSESFTPSAFPMEILRPVNGTVAINSAIQDKSVLRTNLTLHRKMLPPTPGFTNYADAVKSNIVSESSSKKSPFIQIYEDKCSEQEEARPYQHSSPKTVQQYGQKLHSLSEIGDRRSAQEAEAILRGMISKFKLGTSTIQPDGGCYNSVIHAYAAAGLPHQAEEVMRLMFSEFKNDSKSAEPNVRCLTHVLHAWRKSRYPEAPEKCEALLAEMFELGDSNSTLSNCKPDAFAVTVLLHCWVESNRPDGCKHAEHLFRQMQHRFNGVDESMRPDCISYSILLNTYAQKMMVDNAESILWEMVDDFIVNGNTAAEPRTRNFNTILAMHSRSSMVSAPERADNVLRRYRDLCNEDLLQNKPDEYSYSLLLKAWTTSRRDDGIAQALSRLDWMRDLNEDAALPDTVKYTTIISAFARNGDVGEAEALLNRMVNEYLRDKNKRVKPDVQLFDNVIKAFTTPNYVSSSDAQRAESHLRTMWSLYEKSGVNVQPQATTYKHVIVGYKKAGMPEEADNLLWEMELKKVSKPSKELIQTVMNAWHDSRRPDKQQHINALRLFMNDRFIRGTQSLKNGPNKRYK